MNVKVCPDSDLTAYDLAHLSEVSFALVDDQNCMLSHRDGINVDPLDLDLYLGNGIVERKRDHVVVSWRQVLPPAFSDLDRVTMEIEEAVRCFFRSIHVSDTVRPDDSGDNVHSVRELLLGMPPYNSEKVIFNSRLVEDCSPISPRSRLVDTIPPPAPISSEIEGVLITPDGEVLLSPILEVAMQSYLTLDPELSALVESGAVRQARMQAICRPLFVNALRKMKSVKYQPFDSLKKKLRER